MSKIATKEDDSTSARVQNSVGVATLTFRQHLCHIQLHARADSHSGLAGTERSASIKRFLLANGASAAEKKVASKLCYLAAFLAKDASIFTSRKLLASFCNFASKKMLATFLLANATSIFS
jgi:hypothetical protein